MITKLKSTERRVVMPAGAFKFLKNDIRQQKMGQKPGGGLFIRPLACRGEGGLLLRPLYYCDRENYCFSFIHGLNHFCAPA